MNFSSRKFIKTLFAFKLLMLNAKCKIKLYYQKVYYKVLVLGCAFCLVQTYVHDRHFAFGGVLWYTININYSIVHLPIEQVSILAICNN